MPKHDIIVMGASSGGIDALKTILGALPKEFPASLFITVHTHPTGPGYLADVLARGSSLPVLFAGDDQEIRHGVVYVAPPNLHLVIKRGYVRSRFLPKENGTRPAINPMFRSAAHAYARRVIGVVLTGDLDDGAAGLGIIKDEGGITIVQDPKDATHPDMPIAAIKSVKPHYIVPVAEIAPLLLTLAGMEIAGEADTEERETKEIEEVMTCPGCGGVLRHYTDGRTAWYQCMVGHRYTSENMVLQKNTALEEYIWRVLSLLKEKEHVAQTQAADARGSYASPIDPEYYQKQARASEEAQAAIEDILNRLGPDLFPGLPNKDNPQEQEGGDGKGEK